MGLKDMTAGDYVGRAVGMRYFESPNTGTPGIQVAFNVETNSGVEKINWTGWLTEGTRARTAETLVERLGYNGDESTDENGVFTHSEVIDWGRDVKLVIEINDKGYPQIKWVNSLSGSKFGNAEPVSAKSGLAKVGFKAAIISAKQKAGVPIAKSGPTSAPKKDEEIPF